MEEEEKSPNLKSRVPLINLKKKIKMWDLNRVLWGETPNRVEKRGNGDEDAEGERGDGEKSGDLIDDDTIVGVTTDDEAGADGEGIQDTSAGDPWTGRDILTMSLISSLEEELEN